MRLLDSVQEAVKQARQHYELSFQEAKAAITKEYAKKLLSEEGLRKKLKMELEEVKMALNEGWQDDVIVCGINGRCHSYGGW